MDLTLHAFRPPHPPFCAVMKLLRRGVENRRVAATTANTGSSRSHSVFTCVLESATSDGSVNTIRHARLNLVDLAGSESSKVSPSHFS